MKTEFWQERVGEIEGILDQALPSAEVEPQVMHEAMRYAVLGGGKRLRAIMAMAACEAVGGNPAQARGLAAAVEMIHAYSLVHDDLPSMDDDDMRRGKPTTHKKYGEAVAVLAGDALLTEAFAELARMPEKYNVPAAETVRVVAELAKASGSRGLIGGQTVDILSTGKPAIDPEILQYVHSHKTGALFCAALRCGAIIGGASQIQLESITEYGENFGLAFQITDDILDEIGEAAQLGKATGADQRLGKMTYPSLYGIERSREMVRACVEACQRALGKFSAGASVLRALAAMIAERDR